MKNINVHTVLFYLLYIIISSYIYKMLIYVNFWKDDSRKKIKINIGIQESVKAFLLGLLLSYNII